MITDRTLAAVFGWWQQQEEGGGGPRAFDRAVAYFKYVWTSYVNNELHFGNFRISLASLVQGLLVIAVAWFISRSLRSFLQRRMEGHKHFDPSLQYTLLRLLHYFTLTVGLLYAYTTAFNADLTSLAVIFTALSVGVGFGLQYIAGDIASGFILLFERPVRINDYVSVADVKGETQGRVQSINLRSTVVLTNDNIAVIVPNSKLINQTLVNWSYADRRARISIQVGVSYEADVDLVTRTLLEAAEGVKYLLTDPPPSVQFMQFGESSLDFRLLVWTANPRRHPQIRSEINYRIHRLFKEAGIEVPFPQRDIRLRGTAPRLNEEEEVFAAHDAREH